MAQITEVRLVDDLDGGDAVESVVFSLDGKSYEIDLSGKNAVALRDIFAPFVGSARRAGGGSSAGTRQKVFARAGRSREETAEIREWAGAHGHEVAARGRIPSTILEAYASRGSAPAAEVVPAPVAEPEVDAVAEVEVKPKRRSRKKAATAES